MRPAAILRDAVESLERACDSVPALRASTPDGRPAYDVALEQVLAGQKETMNDSQIVLRLPAELVERIDACAAQLRESNPGLRISRSDAVRALIVRALDADAGRKTRR
jgi:hypothetical protein